MSLFFIIIKKAFITTNCGLFICSAANSCPTSPRGGHNRHTLGPDLQMAAYAAAVANPGQIGVIATPTSSAIYVEDK